MYDAKTRETYAALFKTAEARLKLAFAEKLAALFAAHGKSYPEK